MGDRRSLRRLATELESLGTDPAPAPRPVFVDALEARLRAISESPVMMAAPAADTPRRRPLVPVAVFAAIALLAGLAVGRTAGERSVRGISPAASPADSEDRASGVVTGGDAKLTGGPPTAPQGGGALVGTAGTIGSVAADPGTTLPAEEAVASDPGTGELIVDPEETSSRPIGAFGLRGSGTPARIFLDWDEYRGDDFGAYLVLRSIAPDDPQWPAADGRTLLMRRIESRSEVRFDDTPKVGSTTRWRVVVVDARGDVVSRSNVVTPTDGPAMRTPAVSP